LISRSRKNHIGDRVDRQQEALYKTIKK